jgi:hypothetical protein
MSSGGLSETLFKKVDDYVDSLAPQIQPRIASELELFQQKTIDSLETQVIDAFRSLFNRDKPQTAAAAPGTKVMPPQTHTAASRYLSLTKSPN